jgi:hypothetical protein
MSTTLSTRKPMVLVMTVSPARGHGEGDAVEAGLRIVRREGEDAVLHHRVPGQWRGRDQGAGCAGQLELERRSLNDVVGAARSGVVGQRQNSAEVYHRRIRFVPGETERSRPSQCDPRTNDLSDEAFTRRIARPWRTGNRMASAYVERQPCSCGSCSGWLWPKDSKLRPPD